MTEKIHSPGTNITGFDALVFDLDGVITRTAVVHARAWKKMFDEYLAHLEQRGDEGFEAFDEDEDYARYVDGKPRYDGVESFLQSRGITLPYGDADDEPGKETICGLGNRKNEIYRGLLDQAGVEVYEDAVSAIERWRGQGIKTAIVSSSKNCDAVLEAAGLGRLFDARVDGVIAEREKLDGKPAPDIFLRAAEKLEVPPARTAIFEDAVAGVKAGRAGKFGLVVGVCRRGECETLKKNGADVVVRNLLELEREESER